MPKLYNIIMTVLALIHAIMFSVLGYHYVELGYGLHPWIAVPLSLFGIWGCFHFLTLVLDQSIEDQEAEFMKEARELRAQRLAELRSR